MQQYRKNLGKVSLTTEGAWDRNKFYEILSIVYEEHTKHGFISRKAVPVGVDINNKEYWMPFNVSGYADNNTIILNQKESETTIKSYTLEEAIKSIASVGRKPGTILGFYNENTDRLDIGGRWELWQYNGVDVADWENVNSWDSIYYNYNKFAGWYRSEESLKKYIPFPEIGCYAYIGSDLNEAVIYHCDRKYVWTNTTEHVWDYIKVIVGGNVIVGENGNWYNNGVDTNIPASVKGENGKTPIIRNNNNILEISYDNVNWTKISDEMAAWFRINNNKLEMSRHEAGGWEVMSDYIAAWFRWQSQGGQQAFSTGKIQITRDGVTWTDLSGEFVNNLRISRYIGTSESLPTSGIAEGTIYAKGPYYEDGDTLHEYPAYRLWVYAWKGNTLAWVDNGQFTSIAAGIVQDTGNSENAVMSQKAVTEKLAELGSEVRGKEIEGEYNVGKNIGSATIDSSGSIIADSTGYETTYIPVTSGVKYKVRCYDFRLGYVAFYSEIPELGLKGTLIGSHPQQEERKYTYLTYTPNTDGYIAIGYYNGNYKSYQGVAEVFFIGGLKENVENIEKTLGGKVDKVEGKQLSTNDYTNEDKNILESNTKSIESLTTDMYGEPSESEEEIEAVKFLYGRIIHSNIETDYLKVNSSSNQRLYFFPNTAKAKYKVTASVLNQYAGFWGYCNMIPETITGETQLEGKFIQTELRDTSSIQTFTIEDSENYNYLVVGKSPEISDIPTVTKIVVKYNGGVVGKSKETKELLDSIINGTWNDIGYTGKIDIADGNVLSFGSEVSEQEAMAITNDSEIEFVGFSTVPKKSNSYKSGENIVALNHDDLPKSDYIGTRKIYNKYGFHAHFCWIFSPYKSIAEFNDAVKNIRRLVADGHEVGLHAMIGESYWLVNIMNDIRPDGSSSFGLSFDEVTSDSGNGNNVFGVSLSSKLGSVYADLKPTELANVVIGSATEQNILDANSKYCHYSDDSVVTGIDLDGTIQSWTCLKWIEYYYNNLVDESLGYSSESSNIYAKFAEDYVGVYPTAEQLLDGDLGSCGHFTKGLYKGCSSTCNYEVIDRCIEAALAFAKKFLGVNTFVDVHRHGVKYIETMWFENGIYYRNREKTVVDGGAGRFYHSRTKTWKSARDVYSQYGIKSIVQDGIRPHISVEGQTSIYYGQNGKTDDYGITTPKAYGYVGFPNICGVSGSGSVNGDYDSLIQFISGIDDLTKYCYENAGATDIVRNGVTKELVYKTLKDSIDTIVSSIGTGAIPKLCFDTIKNNPAIQLATDLTLRFINQIGYRAVGFGEALEIAKSSKRNCCGNMFPNPNFNQSLVRLLGNTTDVSMKVPDGWKKSGQNGYDIFVEDVNVEDIISKKLTIKADSFSSFHTSVYGLEDGNYEFSFYASSINSGTDIDLFMLKNGDKIYGDGNVSEWNRYIENDSLTKVSYRFTVFDNKINMKTNSPINQMCSGYEDNFCRLVIRINVNKGAEFNFVMPSIKKVL